jgi:tetratricopeptide (TPR) repeat protein
LALHLALALDRWATARRARETKTGQQSWKQLLALAGAVDPDPWRGALRETVAAGGTKEELEKLTKSAPMLELPAATLQLLANFLQRQGATELAVEVLRTAQQRNPADFWINHELATALTKTKWPAPERAIGYYRAALAIRPQSPGVYLNLGAGLQSIGLLDQAIACYQQAIELKKDYAEAHNNLGNALGLKGRTDEAMTSLQEALRLKPELDEAHSNLGIVFGEKGRLDDAILCFQEASRLKPDDGEYHSNLGNALREKGRRDDAILCFKEAIRCFEKAIGLNKNLAFAHRDLGMTLREQGKLDAAIAAYCKASELKPDWAEPHYSIGIALRQQNKLEEAIAAYRKAVALKPDYPTAHCNLGSALRDNGEFAEALSHLKRGHEQGSRNPSWRYPSAQWVKECERLVALDARLSRVLAGEQTVADVRERISFADICYRKRQFELATRFFEEALAADSALAEDLKRGHRYNAACTAALASYGRGKDAGKLAEPERARLRRMALAWLRADLTAWGKLLDLDPDQPRSAIQKQMQHWQQDPDFVGVRGPDALARLPKAERQDWERLWEDVATLRRKAAGSK